MSYFCSEVGTMLAVGKMASEAAFNVVHCSSILNYRFVDSDSVVLSLR